MTDFADTADTLQAAHLARALAQVRPAMPAGVAGECDECGEHMPRLVGGRCGFCRDGRRHPFERSPSTRPATGAPAPVPPPPPVKEMSMPNAPGSKTVGFTARGAVLDAIERRVAAGASTSAAVLALVEAGLAAPPERIVAEAGQLLLDLAAVPLADLLEELRARADRVADHDQLLARATAAEAKLAAIAGVMAPAGAKA